jgi:hypothetical protein
MAISWITGVLLIVVPIGFNVVFFLLQRLFEYPDILRKPTEYILTKFQAGGRRLVVLWYAFGFTGILLIPAALLVPHLLAPGAPVFIAVTSVVGALAALVQILGLIRWPFVVPHLARAYTDPSASQATRDAVGVVFQALHRYAGVAIGEHLGYLFTSAWTILISSCLLRTLGFPVWLGWVGLVSAVGILIGTLEEAGLKAAGAVNALSYILWSIWMILTGVFILRTSI